MRDIILALKRIHEGLAGCKMSFYWEQAVPQDSGSTAGANYGQTASAWDNINLGTPQQQNSYGTVYGDQQQVESSF